MKKVMALIFALVFVLSVTACTSDEYYDSKTQKKEGCFGGSTYGKSKFN